LAVLDRIGFPFRSHDAELLRVRFASRLQELLPPDDLGTDEASLEVGVDGARRLLRRRAARHGPRAHLVVADREERAEPEQLVRRADQTVEGRLRESEILAEGRRLV